MKLCVKMIDKRLYVFESYKLDLLEHWVKVQADGDCRFFPILHVEEVVEFSSGLQESLTNLSSG